MGVLKFQIFFHGMCTFVPSRGGDKMWVFLPATRQLSAGVPVHASYIRYSMIEPDGTPVTQLWRLNNFDLRIHPYHGLPFNIACFDASRDMCSNPCNPAGNCFSWVASAHAACSSRNLPDGGKIDPRFLVRSPLPVADARMLQARLLLREGEVETYSLASVGEDLIVSRFRPFVGALYDSDHRQSTASVVSLTVEVPGDHIVISAHSLLNGRPAGKIALRPSPGSRLIQVDVLNEEAEQLVDISRAEPTQLGMPRQQDRIFESIYNLSLCPPALEDKPIPVSERLIQAPEDYPIVDGSPPCSPSRLLMPSVMLEDSSMEEELSSQIPRRYQRSRMGVLLGRLSALGADDIAMAQEYLVRYGYLAPSAFDRGSIDSATTDALRRFQSFFGLVVTAGLDSETVALMSEPRCGLQDFDGKKRLPSCPWTSVTNLIYDFGSETKQVGAGEGIRAIQDAIDIWNGILKERGIPLQLVKKSSEQVIHVKFEWFEKDPDFDLSGPPVAHADMPPKCSVITKTLPKPVHFDDTEEWATSQTVEKFDIYSVALHEIGHILGLAHSSDVRSVMYPILPADYVFDKGSYPSSDDAGNLSKLYPQ